MEVAAPAHFSLRAFMRSAATLSLGSFANFVRAVLTAKILAVTLGPTAVGVLAQLTNFSGLSGTVVALGLSTGVAQMVASSASDKRVQGRVIGTALAISLGSAVASAIVLAPFGRQLSQALTGTADHWTLVLLVVLSLPLYNVAGVLGYVLQGFAEVGSLTKANIGTAVASVVLLLPATRFFGLFGAVLTILIISAVQVLLLLVPVMSGVRNRVGHLRWLTLSRPIAGRLLGYGGYVLAGGVAVWMVVLAVRTITVHVLGSYENGLYQVAFGFSSQAATIFMTWMAAYVFPRMAASERGSVSGLVNSALRANLVLMVPLLVVGIAFRHELIKLFYSPAFAPAAPLLPIQAFGDFLRVVGWSFGVSLFAHGFVRAHLAIVAGQSLAWAVLSIAAIPLFGLPGVAMSYALSFIVYPAVAIPCARSRFGATMSRENMLLAAIGLGCLAVAAILPVAIGVLTALVVPGLVLTGRWKKEIGSNRPSLSSRSEALTTLRRGLGHRWGYWVAKAKGH